MQVLSVPIVEPPAKRQRIGVHNADSPAGCELVDLDVVAAHARSKLLPSDHTAMLHLLLCSLTPSEESTRDLCMHLRERLLQVSCPCGILALLDRGLVDRRHAAWRKARAFWLV